MAHRGWMVVVAVLAFVGSSSGVSGGQGTAVEISRADGFLGTWVISMTIPKGAQETVRIWENSGRIAASVQAQQFPPIAVTDVARMGKYLVLSAGRFENGRPIQAIILLWRDGENMAMIQELEGSTVTKRGSGRRQQ